jgi:hypothetical protein
MADKTKVRVTIEPGVVREVDRAELLDLHRQGLLYSFERSEVTDDIVGTKSPNRWQPPAKGDDIVEAPASVTDPTEEA